jgi:hypothetical protein
MVRFQRLSVAVLALSLLTFSSMGTSFAAPARQEVRKLVIHISVFNGIRAGTVSAGSKVCAKPMCTFNERTGSKVKLSETPTNSTKHPFKHWSANGTMNKKQTITVKMTRDKVVVKAVYKP